ncbi:lipoyl(octanoyl) transferase [Friedmanniella endophytica]|uniref:Octanoyltransferase n=1 Tax=Microlunatus kandeliicorticis TaxID=1759536 RepID=A0A7W3P5W5_9ACTN|nr:lipoyl(octanoyl) transferase LipB [Microlunatus kandeliicorticis]MBA8794416.1 lipoyl(octanoyl) transferase [Microlunatus kandeliicorticis]
MTLEFRDLGLGRTLVDYTEAWELQRQVHARVVAGELPDTVLELEHAAVYTAGKRTEPHERPVGGSTPVIDVDRGGKITWHGPGQLVCYPIVRLTEAVKVVDYVRRLEEAMIRAFADLGLRTGRIPGRSGVWLGADGRGPERKIAAIGIRVASDVTMHGLSVNVDPDMAAYGAIVPCGIADAGVTSLAAELDRDDLTVAGVAAVLRPRLTELLAFAPYEQSPDVGAPRPEPGRERRVSYGLSPIG